MIKGLKALERIKLQGFVFDDRHNQKDLKIIEKELKALEIIKSMEILSVLESGHYYLVVNMTGIEITKEKYDLLKEVLL